MSSTGQSTSSSVASSSSRAGSTPAPVCTHSAQTTEDPFESAADPREIRAQGHIATFSSGNSSSANGTPPPPPEMTVEEEEGASSSHGTVEWPDDQERARADQLLQGTSTEPGQ